MTYPARKVDGFMITGMLTPPGSTFTYPPDFSTRLGPDYVIDLDFIRAKDGFRHHGLPSKKKMLAQIRKMTHSRAKASLQLMQTEEWDFFMVVFTGTDRLLHFFWDNLVNLVDESADGIQRELLNYLEELDHFIGKLIAQAGSQAISILISDHGFGPAPTHRFYANVWLEKLGLLNRRGARGFLDLEYIRVQIGRQKRLKAILRKILPQATQDAAMTVAKATSGEIVDWSSSSAYYVPIYFHVCGVEINLVGERREGIVLPGEEYNAIRSHIISQAVLLRDPRTGEPIVRLAGRREDFYHGRCVADFPDVILVLDPKYVGVGSLAGTSLFEPHPHPNRPGEHRQDGVFVAAGPPIMPQRDLPSLDLIDLPPTIFYALDLPVPSLFEGRVLTELFEPEYLSEHPVNFQQRPTGPIQADVGELEYSEEQKASIEARLRALGYVD